MRNARKHAILTLLALFAVSWLGTSCGTEIGNGDRFPNKRRPSEEVVEAESQEGAVSDDAKNSPTAAGGIDVEQDLSTEEDYAGTDGKTRSEYLTELEEARTSDSLGEGSVSSPDTNQEETRFPTIALMRKLSPIFSSCNSLLSDALIEPFVLQVWRTNDDYGALFLDFRFTRTTSDQWQVEIFDVRKGDYDNPDLDIPPEATITVELGSAAAELRDEDDALLASFATTCPQEAKSLGQVQPSRYNFTVESFQATITALAGDENGQDQDTNLDWYRSIPEAEEDAEITEGLLTFDGVAYQFVNKEFVLSNE